MTRSSGGNLSNSADAQLAMLKLRIHHPSHSLRAVQAPSDNIIFPWSRSQVCLRSQHLSLRLRYIMDDSRLSLEKSFLIVCITKLYGLLPALTLPVTRTLLSNEHIF